MTWWETIGPLVGVAIGSAGTMLNQKLSDRRTLQRDRLIAEAEAKARLKTERVTLQRETIMEIQDALAAIYAVSSAPVRAQIAPEARAAAAPGALRLPAAIARLEDRDLALRIRNWQRTHESRDAAQEELDAIQEALSTRLRELYAETRS